MNNIQRADVTLLPVLWMTKLQFATHRFVRGHFYSSGPRHSLGRKPLEL
jgi:hypothetical protein